MVILESKKIRSLIVSIISPSICHEVMGADAMILVFECWLSSQLFHSSFTLIKRLFSLSSLSAIRVASSMYLRLLIFPPANLFQLVIHPAQHFAWCTLLLLLLLLSCFSRVWLCATPETAAHQGPPSMGFSRQEYWSGVPSPSLHIS